MGAGSGGGTSGISITGAGLRGFGMIFTTVGAAAFGVLAFRAFAGRAGFARRAFATVGLPRFTFAAFPAFRPDFWDERAFTMTAYATVGRRRRQPRRSVLKCCRGDSTLALRSRARHAADPCSTSPPRQPTPPTSTPTCSCLP